jgi:UDP-2,4-diacetamido-2,4,6-trideoxy-beta-L-altropyranose hydrolase
MGAGHFMRSLALAQAWHDAGGRADFVMATVTLGVEARLADEGMGFVPLSAGPGSVGDALQTADLAQRRRAPWIVADGYQFGGDYQHAVKQTGAGLLVLDDNGHAEHYWADLVLNQNLHAEEGLYRAREPYTRFLLGTRYALLRREFRQRQAPRNGTPAVACRLLVTMGGGDPDNVTLKVLHALNGLGIDGLDTRAVVGAGNPHLRTLQAFARDASVPVQILADVHNMPGVMAWADAAVTAAGSTTWELAYFGIPSITMILADNQERSANLLSERNVFPTLGWAADAEPSTIRDALRQLLLDPTARNSHAEQAGRLVDGAGACRVIEHLRN